jgi:hypothetical protein
VQRSAGTPRLPASCIAVHERQAWPGTTGLCAEPHVPVRDAPIRLVGATRRSPTRRLAARARCHWAVTATRRRGHTSHVVSHASTPCSGRSS